MFEQLIHEVARFAGRLGFQIQLVINPETPCPQCELEAQSPLNDSILETGDRDN